MQGYQCPFLHPSPGTHFLRVSLNLPPKISLDPKTVLSWQAGPSWPLPAPGVVWKAELVFSCFASWSPAPVPHIWVPNGGGVPACLASDSWSVLFPGKEVRWRMYFITWRLIEVFSRQEECSGDWGSHPLTLDTRCHLWMGHSGTRGSVPQGKLVMGLGNTFGALGAPLGPSPELDEICHFWFNPQSFPQISYLPGSGSATS